MKGKINSGARRDFLKKSSLLAIAVTVAPFSSCRDKDEPSPEPENCRTTDDILGPFYLAGAPFKDDIIPEGVVAEPLLVQGRVLSGCQDPIADAIVEIWNANEEGAYDSSVDFFFRGRYRTAADGKYSFRTIVPGRYLNGNTYRPSHIHFRITAPGYAELVSQIYFREDPFIASDPWASAEKAAERILEISTDSTGADIVNFDIHMTKT
jgi:catechol 1,2-dioxygenase